MRPPAGLPIGPKGVYDPAQPPMPRILALTAILFAPQAVCDQLGSDH